MAAARTYGIGAPAAAGPGIATPGSPDEREQHEPRMLTVQELLAGSALIHDVVVPAEVLRPAGGDRRPGRVRIRPMRVATLTLIAKASREDPSLVPLLMIKDAMVEPALELEQIRQMHAGLVHFLVERINQLSGLGAPDDVHSNAASAFSQTHVLLARHFGWTPQQVSELTPGQVAVYLAGIQQLLALESARESSARATR